MIITILFLAITGFFGTFLSFQVISLAIEIIKVIDVLAIQIVLAFLFILFFIGTLPWFYLVFIGPTCIFLAIRELFNSILITLWIKKAPLERPDFFEIEKHSKKEIMEKYNLTEQEYLSFLDEYEKVLLKPLPHTNKYGIKNKNITSPEYQEEFTKKIKTRIQELRTQ